MGKIWSDETKFQLMLDVELAVCQAQRDLGRIPEKDFQQIKDKARFDLNRIREIEEDVRHETIAFLTCVNENVGPSSRYIHLGLTSSDVLDTALSLQLVKAVELIAQDLNSLRKAILEQCKKHKHTVCIGRSHGIHAEPTTFGFKLAIWLNEIDRHILRLDQAKEMVAVGKISGAVGTYSNIDPDVEEITCRLLGLKRDPISTQIIQRDRHAQLISVLALIASSLDKFAQEIRHLQRTDVLEVEEPFARGQKGSSAMPHKRNPIGCENICGLARIVRSNAFAAMEDIALWHERDMSHSSVERIILPDSTILLDYMLDRFTSIMKDLVVYPENMAKNMNKYGGIVFSQSILLKLTEAGMSREEAYKHVQDAAMLAWNNGNFKDNILENKAIVNLIPNGELEECLKPEKHLKNIDKVFARLGID